LHSLDFRGHMLNNHRESIAPLRVPQGDLLTRPFHGLAAAGCSSAAEGLRPGHR
jgi:hypothetical protein